MDNELGFQIAMVPYFAGASIRLLAKEEYPPDEPYDAEHPKALIELGNEEPEFRFVTCVTCFTDFLVDGLKEARQEALGREYGLG